MTTDNLDIFGEEEVKADPMPGLVEATEEQKEAQESFEPAVDVDLTVDRPEADEGHRDTSHERKYLIEIDEVEGRPNFETVGVNGTIYKIKRGEPVEVPESVVEVLNNAVAERLVQTDSPTGGVNTRRQRYSSVPFRVLKAM